MGRIVKLIAIVVLCISLAVVLKTWADSRISHVNGNCRSITLEIDYGSIQPSRAVKIPCSKGRTVLELLQAVANVETHPVGEYVFVASIDGVKGSRGDMGWYYSIDGKSADKLAYAKAADSARSIKWIYKKDVCSAKVDNIR